MDDQQFHKLLDFFGLSWEGYRKVRNGIKKRIARHMQEYGYRSMEAFLASLEKNQGQREQVEKLMTVSISRFFRNRRLWPMIEKDILPRITAKGDRKIKVWCAGCARGEEVYSLKILWEEWGRDQDQLPELALWATDMNPLYIEKAREGIYPLSSLKELPEEWRSKYFCPMPGNRWALSDSLKEGIRWKAHNHSIDEPPAKEFQVIFLRNSLLTYYKDEIQRRGLHKVSASLSPGGFLIIGAHEKIPKDFIELVPFLHHPSIFQKTLFFPSPLCGRGRG